jgi:hypothetical protein
MGKYGIKIELFVWIRTRSYRTIFKLLFFLRKKKTFEPFIEG